MDKRLEQALEFSNFRLVLAAKQENLKNLLQNKLIITYENDLFNINTNLLVLVREVINLNLREFIFIDINDTPVLIKDLIDFWDKIFLQYNKAVLQYYNSYQELNKARDIRKVIDWADKVKD